MRAFRKLLSVYVYSYVPFGFKGRIWSLIVSVPDHCLSFYFTAVVKIVSLCVGTFSGGLLTRKIKLNPPKTLMLIVGACIPAVLLTLVTMFLACEPAVILNWPSDVNRYRNKHRIRSLFV